MLDTASDLNRFDTNETNCKSVIINGNCNGKSTHHYSNNLDTDVIPSEVSTFRNNCHTNTIDDRPRVRQNPPHNDPRYHHRELLEHSDDDYMMQPQERHGCSINGSHERPPPPQYRRNDYPPHHRAYDTNMRVMTLGRRRMEEPVSYHQCLLSLT